MPLSATECHRVPLIVLVNLRVPLIVPLIVLVNLVNLRAASGLRARATACAARLSHVTTTSAGTRTARWSITSHCACTSTPYCARGSSTPLAVHSSSSLLATACPYAARRASGVCPKGNYPTRAWSTDIARVHNILCLNMYDADTALLSSKSCFVPSFGPLACSCAFFPAESRLPSLILQAASAPCRSP